MRNLQLHNQGKQDLINLLKESFLSQKTEIENSKTLTDEEKTKQIQLLKEEIEVKKKQGNGRCFNYLNSKFAN